MFVVIVINIYLAALVANVATCYQIFSWVSRYGKVTRKINRHTYMFFIIYLTSSVTPLLSEVVGPAHLETICSQKGTGQQEAMCYRLV